MRRRREETYESVGEVEIVKETEKAYLCRWTDGQDHAGKERWVPKGQVAPGLGPAVGDVVDLEVSDWFGGRIWEDAPEREKVWVTVPSVVVMRQTDKAIQVRVDGHPQLLWIPLSQVKPGSEVTGDGDSGVLTISEYIAKEKGLDGKPEEGENAGEAARRRPAPSSDPDDDLKF